jgi:hypothetical protein
VADIDPDEDEDEDYLGTYRAVEWELYEFPLTPIEADVNSGIGRSAERAHIQEEGYADQLSALLGQQEELQRQARTRPGESCRSERSCQAD